MIVWTEYEPGSHRIECPSCGRGGRDKTAGLKLEHDGKGVVHCFRCGYVETGNPEGAAVRRTPVAVAPAKAQSPVRTDLSEWGRELWRNCHPLNGVAVSYLKARNCRVPPEDGHLRYHPALKHHSSHVGPALVALITHVMTGKHLSLHRTWITPTGKADIDPPRMLLGNHSITGGCIRLWPDEAVTYGLGLAEGIETALSLAWGYTPVWATIDAGHLASFPVLEGVESLVIAQDQDAAGVAAASACACRWAAADREVLVTRQPENDLNDVLAEVSA